METGSQAVTAIPTPRGDRPAGEAFGRRMAAERDALLELVAIFTHDLSNPLQSLTVLCELAQDEAEPNTEEHARTSQCLEAAERMRGLIHGLATITRHVDGPLHVGSIVARSLALLGRRLDRYVFDLDVDVSEIERVVPPPGIEFGLLNIGLGLIASAADGNRHRHTMQIHGHRLSDKPARCALDIEAAAIDRSSEQRPMTMSPRHIKRAEHLMGESTAAQISTAGSRLRLSFAPLSEG